MHIADLVERWQASIDNANTARFYVSAIGELLEWSGRSDVRLLSKDELVEFISSLRPLPKQARAISAIHHFFGYLTEEGHIDSNRAASIYIKRLTRPTNRDLILRIPELRPDDRWLDLACLLAKSAKNAQARALGERLVQLLRRCRSVEELYGVLRERIVR